MNTRLATRSTNVEFEPPRRRPTWPRWRPAMHLAVRDAQFNRARSLVVIALVALPVALVCGIFYYGTSSQAGAPMLAQTWLGIAADGSVEPGGNGSQDHWTAPLPDDWRLVPWPMDYAESEANPGIGVAGTSGDFDDSVVAGLVDVTAGRTPESAREVLLSEALADDLNLTVGDTWSARVIGEVGFVSAGPPEELNVVGIGEFAGHGGEQGFATGARDLPEGAAVARYLIDSPEPITVAEVDQAAASGLLLVARGLPVAQPGGSGSGLTLSGTLVVGLALAFLQIVMLSGAAFAVSVRRRQRELALLSAAGAEPGDLTRAMLASGILLGSIGACVGFVVPWLVLVVGRPLFERLAHQPLAAFPPMELAIVLVPIVGILSCGAASVVPAILASRIPLAQALRARDSVHLGGPPTSQGVGRVASRSAVLGLALVAAGLFGFTRYARSSAAQPGGFEPFGWLDATLGLSVLLTEIGIVLLAPILLALIAGRLRWLPVAARLATRDASRNRLRTSFAVAAVAVSVGLLAAAVTYVGSIDSAVKGAYHPALPPGAMVLQAPWPQGGPNELTSEQVEAVAADLPDAQAVRIGFGPNYDLQEGTSLALKSWCDPVADLGASAEALTVMDPRQRAAVATGLAPGSPCRAPLPAGDPIAPAATLGEPWSWRPGLVIADPDAAALLVGRDDPAVRKQLTSGGVVALSPNVVVGGHVRIATDSYLATADQRQSGQWRSGPVADLPAIVVRSAYRPAAVIVTPEALTEAGLAAPMNALLVVPAQGSTAVSDGGEPVTVGGLSAVHVERGSSSWGFVGWDSWSGAQTGTTPWRLVLLPLGFALLATVLVTWLALGEAGPELATMVAVGASPRVRRGFAMWSAVLVSLVGGFLGTLAGIGPAWAALRTANVATDLSQCLWLSPADASGSTDKGQPAVDQLLGVRYCDVPLDVALHIPWLWLAGAVLGLALVSAVFFVAVAQAKVVLPRR